MMGAGFDELGGGAWLSKDDGEEGVSQEGQSGGDVWIFGTATIFSEAMVTGPMISVFDGGPVTGDEIGKLLGGSLLLLQAGEVVAGFLGGDLGFDEGALLSTASKVLEKGKSQEVGSTQVRFSFRESIRP